MYIYIYICIYIYIYIHICASTAAHVRTKNLHAKLLTRSRTFGGFDPRVVPDMRCEPPEYNGKHRTQLPFCKILGASEVEHRRHRPPLSVRLLQAPGCI